MVEEEEKGVEREGGKKEEEKGMSGEVRKELDFGGQKSGKKKKKNQN